MWAENHETSILSRHSQWGIFDVQLSNQPTYDQILVYSWEFHGIIMWISWCLCAFLMIVTMRWSKAYLSHAFVGTVITGSSVYSSFLSIKRKGLIQQEFHAYAGLILTILVSILWLNGLISYLLMLFSIKVDFMLKLKRSHKYLGYSVLVLSFFTVSSGIFRYFDFIAHETVGYLTFLGGLNIIIFITLFSLFEIRHK